MLVYVDSSAVMKRLAVEEESDDLERYLTNLVSRGHQMISSDLLEIELWRAAVRDGIDTAEVESSLEEVHLVGILPEVVEAAKGITQTIKALDSIHLATALLLKDEAEGEEAVEQVITYDSRMRAVAEELGFEVVSPGRP